MVWVWRLWPLWLALVVGLGAYRAGYRQADTAARLAAATQQAAWQAQRLAAEEAYAAKLAEAAAEKQRWYDFAQVQSSKLAETTRRLDAQAAQIKKEIADAVHGDAQNGGDCRPGLGPDSLHLYQRALGY